VLSSIDDPPSRRIFTPWRAVAGCLIAWGAFFGFFIVLAVYHDPVPSDFVASSLRTALACGTLASWGWLGFDWLDRRDAERTRLIQAQLDEAADATPRVVYVVGRNPLPVPTGPVRVEPGALDPEVLAAARKLRLRLTSGGHHVRR
jgi:hypothetical protein